MSIDIFCESLLRQFNSIQWYLFHVRDLYVCLERLFLFIWRIHSHSALVLITTLNDGFVCTSEMCCTCTHVKKENGHGLDFRHPSGFEYTFHHFNALKANLNPIDELKFATCSNLAAISAYTSKSDVQIKHDCLITTESVESNRVTGTCPIPYDSCPIFRKFNWHLPNAIETCPSTFLRLFSTYQVWEASNASEFLNSFLCHENCELKLN